LCATPALSAPCRGRNAHRSPLLRADPCYRTLRLDCRRRVCGHGWPPRSCRLAMAVSSVCWPCTLSFGDDAEDAYDEGGVTALVALFGFFLLPNEPLTTPWLTPREREMAHARIERDRVGDSAEPASVLEGLRQACRDKRTWLFCLMRNFHLSACSFNSFFPTYVSFSPMVTTSALGTSLVGYSLPSSDSSLRLTQ